MGLFNKGNKKGEVNTVVSPQKNSEHYNVTIEIYDDAYTSIGMDEDKNITSFATWHPSNKEIVSFYYMLFNKKERIGINYNDFIFETYITQIRVLKENEIFIYFTVCNNISNKCKSKVLNEYVTIQQKN